MVDILSVIYLSSCSILIQVVTFYLQYTFYILQKMNNLNIKKNRIHWQKKKKKKQNRKCYFILIDIFILMNLDDHSRVIIKKNAGSADDYINANYLDVSNILCFLFFKDISISSVSNSNLAVVINAWYILTELYFL